MCSVAFAITSTITSAAPSSWGPTADVLDVTGRRAEDFETIARRHVALRGDQWTLGNRLRRFAQSFQKNHMNDQPENLTRPNEVSR